MVWAAGCNVRQLGFMVTVAIKKPKQPRAAEIPPLWDSTKREKSLESMNVFFSGRFASQSFIDQILL